MKELTFEEWRRRWDDWDQIAFAMEPGFDGYCSSSYWGPPALASNLYPPQGSPWIFADDSSVVVFKRARRQGRTEAWPMDSGWFLGSPIVSLDYAATLERWLRKQALANTLPDVLVLSGVPSWSRYASVVGLFLSTTYDLYALKRTERAVASLCGGWEGYLSRRSANFRRSLKKALNRSERAGWSMEWHEGSGIDHHTLYRRVLAIESKSWKGQIGSGLSTGSMSEFYRLALPRLAHRGALRLGFLTSEGQDLGFILGAVVGERYRGLQFSFDDRFRDGSPGDVMQGLQIRRLVEQEVLEYDLGTEAPYKIRWAENLEGTETFVALRPGLSIESVFSE